MTCACRMCRPRDPCVGMVRLPHTRICEGCVEWHLVVWKTMATALLTALCCSYTMGSAHRLSVARARPIIAAAASLEPLQLLDGDAMEAKWDRLRGRPLRRSIALWRFFSVASWKTVRANMTDDEALTNVTAAWVRNGLLNLGPTMVRQLLPQHPP